MITEDQDMTHGVGGKDWIGDSTGECRAAQAAINAIASWAGIDVMTAETGRSLLAWKSQVGPHLISTLSKGRHQLRDDGRSGTGCAGGKAQRA
jgi:hypothetical protein